MARILVVDDDDNLRRMLRLMLEPLGHSVSEARNGRDAVGLIRQQSFDLVMTDLIMPDMEGIELIQQLRREKTSVRIVAMSGGGRMNPADLLEMALLLGADRILTKPFTDAELVGVLQGLLPER